MSRKILILQLKEEWRMTTSYFRSEKMFLLFPIVLFVLGFFTTSLIPLLEQTFDMKELLEALHLLLILYGVFVGGFGFFADAVAQQWFGEARLLVHMYDVLPISFKRIFSWFYVKDILYYLFLTLYPLLLGAFLSFKIPPMIFIKITVSLTFSFLIGVSASFFISSLYVRKKVSLLAGIPFFFCVYFAGMSYKNFPPLSFFLKGDLSQLLISAVIFIVLSAVSLNIAIPVERYRKKPVSRSKLFSSIDPLLAKEIIELRRSGTWHIILTSYLFPLFFLYGIFYFSGKLLKFDVEIPLVFYSVFIGYLSTLVYSWLNNIDTPSFIRTLPIKTSEVIKRKITLFSVSSLCIGTTYLVILGHILDDMMLLPLSLFSMAAVTLYVAAVTAYLCGLYPNTYLFNGNILAQYLLTTLPTLMMLSILSLMGAYVEIFLLSTVILFLSMPLYKRLDKKYGERYFLD